MLQNEKIFNIRTLSQIKLTNYLIQNMPVLIPVSFIKIESICIISDIFVQRLPAADSRLLLKQISEGKIQ